MERLHVIRRHLHTTHAETVASKREGTVEILWDTFGVPHIIAPDHPKLFYACATLFRASCLIGHFCVLPCLKQPAALPNAQYTLPGHRW